jgi:hypothetical protein
MTKGTVQSVAERPPARARRSVPKSASVPGSEVELESGNPSNAGIASGSTLTNIDAELSTEGEDDKAMCAGLRMKTPAVRSRSLFLGILITVDLSETYLLLTWAQVNSFF